MKESANLQDIIKTNNPYYKLKSRKVDNFSEYSLIIVYKRYAWRAFIIKRCWCDECKNFAVKINNLDNCQKSSIQKEFFFNTLGLLFSARENSNR